MQVILRINTRLYPSGHPSSYNPVRSGLTWNSVLKGNALTASATRASHSFDQFYFLRRGGPNLRRISKKGTDNCQVDVRLVVVMYMWWW